MQQQLRITEIFYSLQGEADSVGMPTTFIRLTGCPLRCQYCDSEYAFTGGKNLSFTEILTEVKATGAHYVCVTGGEPLAQRNVLGLMTLLCDEGYRVSIETSGALDISVIDSRVIKVMDLKTPGSLEVSKNLLENLTHLAPADQVKFVICDRADFDWAKSMMAEHDLTTRCQVLFSASHQQLAAQQLADWILADKLQVRFQMQLHKYIWGDIPGK